MTQWERQLAKQNIRPKYLTLAAFSTSLLFGAWSAAAEANEPSIYCQHDEYRFVDEMTAREGCSVDWSLISQEQYKKGLAAEELLDSEKSGPTEEGESVVAHPDSIMPLWQHFITIKNANVRVRPDNTSERITTLPKGTVVDVHGKVRDKNWYLISEGTTGPRHGVENLLGYIFGDLLALGVEEVYLGTDSAKLLKPSPGPKECYGCNLNGVDLRGAYLVDAKLRYSEFYKANLANANLAGADLGGSSSDGWPYKLSKADLSGANLEGSRLDQKDLRWSNFTNANLAKADLSKSMLNGANFEAANLKEANLYYSNLAGAELGYANLSGANLINANLSEANLYGAVLVEADLTEANLSGAGVYCWFRGCFTGANLEDANFIGANLSKANLSSAYLRRTEMSGADLREANLKGTQLGYGSHFIGADLRGADLEGARGRTAVFDYAIMAGVNMTDFYVRQGSAIKTNFRGANLESATFHQSDLDGANFSDANLTGASFGSSSLKGANFSNANLSGASFGGADLEGSDMTETDTSSTIFCNTIMPNGDVNNSGCDK